MIALKTCILNQASRLMTGELQGLAVPVNLKNFQTNWNVNFTTQEPKTLHVGSLLTITPSKAK